MHAMIFIGYLIALVIINIRCLIRLRANPVGWVCLTASLLAGLLGDVIGFFLVAGFDSYISSFSDRGFFLYIFVAQIYLIIQLILVIIGLVIKIRCKLSQKNTFRLWLIQASWILLGYLACIQLPYIWALQCYKFQEAEAKAYLQSYIQSTHPRAELISFDKHRTHSIFFSDLIGFKYTIRLYDEYFEISVSDANHSWIGKLDVIDDELACLSKEP